MNRLEKLARAVVIALILFILRIRWEFSITGSTDIEDWNNKLESQSLVETESMAVR